MINALKEFISKPEELMLYYFQNGNKRCFFDQLIMEIGVFMERLVSGSGS